MKLALLTAFLSTTLAYNGVTCEQYGDRIDYTYCRGKANGSYPVNDDQCSLYYTCFNNMTTCSSCDIEQEDGANYSPRFAMVERISPEQELYGYCAPANVAPCPTPGYPILAPEPTEEPVTANTEVNTEESFRANKFMR